MSNLHLLLLWLNQKLTKQSPLQHPLDMKITNQVAVSSIVRHPDRFSRKGKLANISFVTTYRTLCSTSPASPRSLTNLISMRVKV